MKVLLTKKFAASDIAYMDERLDDGITLFEPENFSESGVLDSIGNANVLLGGMLSPAIVERSAHLNFVQIPWTGVDNLNFSLLQQHDITVCNSHSNSNIVAEHAIALAFSIAKKIPYHDAQMRHGNWNRLSKEGNAVSPFSSNLMNRKITFIGYGAIAQAIHRLLLGFAPEVSAVTKTGASKSNNDAVVMYKSEDIQNAVKKADFVFVCAPLTESTRNIVDQSVFDAMPDHALIINVSRGVVVSEEALYYSLSNAIIAGAAIDTWYQNPTPNEKVNFPSDKFDFQCLDNLVMSPHRAGYIDSGFPHLDDAIDNLNRAKRGHSLMNVVSSSSNY